MNVQPLMDAIAALETEDALRTDLSRDDWERLSHHVSVRFLKIGDVLIHEGENDRELYLLEAGTLDVSIQGTLVATLQAGTVVGEGTFFSGKSRSATVTAASKGVAWALTWEKFDAYGKKQPRAALELAKGAASVLACRMRDAILVGHFT